MSANPRRVPPAAALAAALTMTACTARPATPGAVAPAAAPASAVRTDPPPTTAQQSTAAPPSDPGPPATCAGAASWTTASKHAGAPGSQAPVYAVRAGQHPAECYDRINFDLNGPDAVGYFADYIPADRVVTEGDGAPLTLPGAAFLRVVISGPILGRDTQGHQPWRAAPRPGDPLLDAAQVRGWPTVTCVVYAGGHPGETVVIVGLRAKAAFHVDASWVDPQTRIRVVSLDLRRP